FNDTKAKLTDLVLSIQHGPGPLKTKTEAPSQVNIELPEIAFECQLHLDNKALSISLEGEGGTNNERKAILTELGPQLLQQRVNQRFSLLPSKLNLAQLNNNFIVEDLLKKVEAVRQRQ
uniref:Uncharacterized protein n=1 Tax=Meloidogyne javanica TaxID=6303 RepID=A0A915MN63_MELJA